MTRVILDAGALIAFERGDQATRARLAAASRLGLEVVTTSPVVAQVWRDRRRQVLLARLLAGIRVDEPSDQDARTAGELLAKTRTTDVVDALLVGLASDRDELLTSDAGDLRPLLAARRVRARVVTV